MQTTFKGITYRTVPSLGVEGGVSICKGCAADRDPEDVCQAIAYREHVTLCPNTVWIEDTEEGRRNYITMRLAI